MNKNNQANLLGLLVLGFGLGVGLATGILLPKITPLTISQIEVKKVADFKIVEAICGENNVSELCSDDTNGCKVITGFACNNYRNAAHKEEIEKERKERVEQQKKDFPEFYK